MTPTERPTRALLDLASGAGRSRCYAALKALMARGVVEKNGIRGKTRYRLTGRADQG